MAAVCGDNVNYQLCSCTMLQFCKRRFWCELCRRSGRKVGLLSLRRAAFSAEEGRLVCYLFALMLLQK